MSAAPPVADAHGSCARVFPEVLPGAIWQALLAQKRSRVPDLQLIASDVLVVAQKVISKAEGRYARLADVVPGARAPARNSPAVTGKDARLIELILAESTEVLRAQRGLLIVRHRLGLPSWPTLPASTAPTSAAAGGRRARAAPAARPGTPPPQRRCAALAQRCGVACGLIISDSFGRPWRKGVVNVAIAAAEVTALALDRPRQRPTAPGARWK